MSRVRYHRRLLQVRGATAQQHPPRSTAPCAPCSTHCTRKGCSRKRQRAAWSLGTPTPKSTQATAGRIRHKLPYLPPVTGYERRTCPTQTWSDTAASRSSKLDSFTVSVGNCCGKPMSECMGCRSAPDIESRASLMSVKVPACAYVGAHEVIGDSLSHNVPWAKPSPCV